MDERKYNVGDLYERNHFNRRKINGKWRYWRDGENRAEGMLHNLKRKIGIMTPNEDMAA